MGAGASACGSEDSSAIFSQLMAKWDTLQEMPQYRSDVKKPENYDELLKITMPAGGPEREFFLAMRDSFQEASKETKSAIIEILAHEDCFAKGSTLQDAFKNRPVTSKKRPNRKRLQMKREAQRDAASPFVA